MSTAMVVSKQEALDKAARASKALAAMRGESNSPMSPGNVWDDFCAIGGGIAAGAARGAMEKVGPMPTDSALAIATVGLGVGTGYDSVVKFGVGAGAYAAGRWAEDMVRAAKAKRAAAADE